MSLKLFKQHILVIVFMLTSVSVFAEDSLRPFVSGSFSQILEKNDNNNPLFWCCGHWTAHPVTKNLRC